MKDFDISRSAVEHLIDEWIFKERDRQKVLEVIDDLMTALAVLNPKLYDSVMRKL